MSSKHAIGWIMLICLSLVFLPRTGHSAEWDFSPYRAQVAESQSENGDESAAFDSGLPKKNIGKAAMFSLIIPGAGQMYAGSWKTAIPWFAIEVASWAMFASYKSKGNDKTKEFEAYAGKRDLPNHFDYRAYMYQEYELARDTLRSGKPASDVFNGSFEDWLAMPWDGDPDTRNNRYYYLPAPFTHDVMTDDEQQYFEMIGKYILQFGFGWRDTYNNGDGWTSGLNRTAWESPAGGLRPDNPNNREFDGESLLFFVYRDMRGDANDLLDKANVAMEVVLVNHMLSALHAAFLVRGYNRNLERTASPLGDLRLHYDAKSFDGSMTRCLTLSYPIR